MTILLYQMDSYLREFDAEVVAQDAAQNGIVLDRSAFYPGGGGQLPDIGMISVGQTDYAVSGVKRGNAHIIDGELPPVGRRYGASLIGSGVTKSCGRIRRCTSYAE